MFKKILDLLLNFCSLYEKIDRTELEEEPSREWGSEAGSGQATVLSERWDRASQWLQYLPAEGQQQVWSHCGCSQYIIIVHVPGICNYTFYMYMYMAILHVHVYGYLHCHVKKFSEYIEDSYD